MNNIQLGLRTLALVALVVFSTAVLVQPGAAQAIGSIPVVGHH